MNSSTQVSPEAADKPSSLNGGRLEGPSLQPGSSHSQNTSVSSSQPSSVDRQLIRTALDLLNQGHMGRAVENFTQLIECDRNNAQAWSYRAQAHMQMGAYDAALSDFREVLRINPTDARAWHGQGVAKAELKLFPSAIDSFDQAAKCDPQNPKTWYNRGRALLRLQQHEKALKSFDKAIALNPKKYYTWYNRGLAQAALAHVQPAIESLEQVLELKPSCHYAWNYRGTLLNRLFKHDEALQSFWESLKHRVPNPNAWYGLASSYALQNNPEAAAIHLSQALQLNPNIYSLMARNDDNFDLVKNHPKIRAILPD